MVRNHIRKTTFGQVSSDTMKAAVLKVAESKHSIRSVANEFNISKTTLQRYVEKFKKVKDQNGSFHRYEHYILTKFYRYYLGFQRLKHFCRLLKNLPYIMLS